MIKTSAWILNECSSNVNILHTTQSDMFQILKTQDNYQDDFVFLKT